MVLLVKKSFADEVLKSRDISKLQKVQITDKNGHKKTVYKKAGEQPTEEKTSKKESQPVDKKRVAKYQDMLEKVKNGPDENALKVQGEIMDKEKATKYLENKLSKISGKNATSESKEKTPAKTTEDKVLDKLEGKKSESTNLELDGKSKDELMELFKNSKNPDEKDKIMEKIANFDANEAVSKNPELTAYKQKIEELKKTDVQAYMKFKDAANRDYKGYTMMRDKADMAERIPYLKNIFEYQVAAGKAKDYEKQYPDFKTSYDNGARTYNI